MKTFFVVVALSINTSVPGVYSVDQNERFYPIENMEECRILKHQKEFLPPIGATTAEVYFCMEK